MKKALCVRAKPHGVDREKQFLAGDISIGWPEMGDLDGADRATIQSALEKRRPDVASSLTGSQIYKFVDLPVGSLVLTPSYETRGVHLFRTKSGYRYREDWRKGGNPHTIKVEYIKTVSRDTFPEQVQRALLAARKAVTDFSKYEPAISSIADGQGPCGDGAPSTAASPDAVEARRTLRELLSSEDEHVRLKAAMALLGYRAP